MVRVAQCEVCLGQFYLEGTEVPLRCALCGTTMWLYGLRTNRSSSFTRKGMDKGEKVLNKGVALSKAKLSRMGKTQWRQFKEKPEEKPD
jgi:hypothetical protein